MTTMQAELAKALEAKTGQPVLVGKGGYWIREQGFVTTRQARNLTGLPAPKRECRRGLPWGDYATIAMLNQARKGA